MNDYHNGFVDGQWSVHKAGEAIITEDSTGRLTLSFEPHNCEVVLITRALLESMIKSLNETTE